MQFASAYLAEVLGRVQSNEEEFTTYKWTED